MKKYCKALTNLTIALVVLLLIIFVVPRFLLFFMPFVVGWIIALIAGPLVRFFEKKIKLKRKAGSALVIVVIIGLVVLLLYLIGSKLVEQIIGLVNALPSIWESAETDFRDISRNLSVVYAKLPLDVQESITDVTQQIGSYIGDFLGKISTPTITAAGNFAKQLPSVVIGIIMALLSSYFFVAERGRLSAWFRRTMPAAIQSRYDMVCRGLSKAVGGYLKAQLKIEVWMYLLLLIGLSILRVEYAFLIALGIAFLDFLPFFGTGTAMVPWAILKILSADYIMAIGLLIIWGGGQLARQLIQPKIVGDSVGLEPLPTLFLLFIGYKISGVFGMLVSVPVGLVVFTMYQEGVFDTTQKSIQILVAGINHFRRLEPEDLKQVEEMSKVEEAAGAEGMLRTEESPRKEQEHEKH